MSNVNIRRAVENIRSGANAYTPLVEVIVNAIQAIEVIERQDGSIQIVVDREGQVDQEDSVSGVSGFTVLDNGIGFTDENRDSFDTLYSSHKIAEGGKGFGRLTCLKYFEEITVESTFLKGKTCFKRRFKMGTDNEIIIGEEVQESQEKTTGSIVRLVELRKDFPDKKLLTLARVLVERLLPYFFDDARTPPQIVLMEKDKSDRVVLNDYFKDQGAMQIQELRSSSGEFTFNSTEGEKLFKARVFKFYSPRTQVSKVSLVAHRREVTSASLHKYIPEFVEEFYDKGPDGEENKLKNFIIKVYVFSEYLDENVSLERGGFEFQKDADAIYGIAQGQIEEKAAEYAKNSVSHDVEARVEKKYKRVADYITEKAPWHTGVMEDIDLDDMPYQANDSQIESKLQSIKYEKENLVRNEVKKLLENSEPDELKEKAADIVRRISGSSKNDLAHYVALRRSVIDLFEKSLELDDSGNYSSEGVVHDIIFPRRGDSDKTPFNEHNLWLIDERLNFTEYVSSDQALKGVSDRPDLLAYDKRVVFRGENIASNPVTIFEFKKPQRDDFVNPSSNEDPVQQIIRYVRRLRSRDFKTPQGRDILISDNTPFYGFVVCDLAKKVKSWLEEEKDFKPMPDRLGYFKWHENLNLYIEVIGWDKVLKDATMRNRIFFHKLGIE